MMASEIRTRQNGETDWAINAGDEVGAVVRFVEAIRVALEQPDPMSSIIAVRLALAAFDESD